MTLSPSSTEDLHWWVASTPSAFNVVSNSKYDMVIQTDASTTGWGGVLGDSSTGGHLTPVESLFHINYLEILAVLMTLKAFCNQIRGKHVHVLIDNTTAVATLNHMGTSHSRDCNAACGLVWDWCVSNSVWLSASHIPGSPIPWLTKSHVYIWVLKRKTLSFSVPALGVHMISYNSVFHQSDWPIR